MPKLILVSGWANTAGSLAALADRLSRAWDVCALGVHELAGGATEQPPGFHAPSPYALGLAGRIERGGAACALVGWSMGGMIALEAAALCGGKVNPLVLISSTRRFCSGAGQRHGVPQAVLQEMRRELRANPEAALTGFFRNMAFPRDEKPVDLKRKVGAATALGTEALAAGLHYLEEADLRPLRLAAGVRVLVMHGRKDAIIPWRAGHALARSLPNSSWLPREGAGHDLPLQERRFVAERIRKFAGA